MKPSLLLYAVVRGIVALFCRVYWRLTIEGRENLPREGAYLLAPIHRSNIDTPIAAALTARRIRFMGKDTMWKYDLPGKLFTALGAFPVQRGSAAARSALTAATAELAKGEPVVMFPEGTRQSGPIVQPLFDGTALVASRAQVPIVPVGIGGSEGAMPKGSKFLRPVKVHAIIGKPIPAPAAGEDGGRVPRRVLHETTEALHAELQRLFDAAQAKVGN